MHLSVVYPVYRASGAYRLNNTGAREWRKGGEGTKGWRWFGGPRGCDDARLRFDRELIHRCDTPLNSLKWDYISRYCDLRRKEELIQISGFVQAPGRPRRLASPRITEGAEFIGQRRLSSGPCRPYFSKLCPRWGLISGESVEGCRDLGCSRGRFEFRHREFRKLEGIATVENGMTWE